MVLSICVRIENQSQSKYERHGVAHGVAVPESQELVDCRRHGQQTASGEVHWRPDINGARDGFTSRMNVGGKHVCSGGRATREGA